MRLAERKARRGQVMLRITRLLAKVKCTLYEFLLDEDLRITHWDGYAL